jgi:hypothetical protein
MDDQNHDTSEVDVEAILGELAMLSDLDYKGERKAAAKLLDMRVAKLDAEVEKRRPVEEEVAEEIIEEEPAKDQGEGAADRNTSVANELVNMVKVCTTLFCDDEKTPFAQIPVGDHQEIWAVDSEGFREWLSFQYYQKTERAPSDSAVSTALSAVRGIAKFEGEVEKVWLRCAPYQDGYAIDLCDEQWRVVVIRPGSWQIISRSPVKFTRTQAMQVLPTPDGRGDLRKLWQYANVEEPDRPFLLAVMLEALRPDTPHPVLEIGGFYGSAKSTTQKVIRRCIDPNKQDLRVEPKSVEDLLVGARNNWLVSLNNLSHLSPRRQDAICSISTGGGVGARTLYTNNEETIFEIKRPVIMNGIKTLATAPDLVDRVIRLELPKLEKYQEERAVWAGFEQDHAAIFTGLLDLFAASLRALASITIDRPYRMADFCYLGEAVFRALRVPASFMKAYAAKRSLAAEKSLDGISTASALRAFIDRVGEWSGPIGKLYQALEPYVPKHGAWPNSPRGLGDSLRVVAPPLALMGISIDFDPQRHNDGYHVHISRKHAPASEKEPPSPRSPRSRPSQHAQPAAREEREHRERVNGQSFPEPPEGFADIHEIRQYMAATGEDPEDIETEIQRALKDPQIMKGYLDMARRANNT